MLSKTDLLKDPSLVLVLHPALDIVPIAENRIQLRGVNDNLTFEDATGVSRLLFARCNGTTHVGEILVGLISEDQQDAFLRLLSMLYARGMLIKASEAFRGDSFLRQIDFLRRQVQRNFDAKGVGYEPLFDCSVTELGNVTVNLFGRGQLSCAAAALLANWGFNVERNPSANELASRTANKSIALVCADVDDRTSMLERNAEFVAAKMPALYCCVNEYVVRVGPFVVPGETACFECYDRRVRSLLTHPGEFDAFAVKNHNGNGSDHHQPVFAGSLGAFLAASTLTKFVCGIPHHANVGELIEFNTISNKSTTSPVLKLPRCPVCGGGGTASIPAAIRGRFR